MGEGYARELATDIPAASWNQGEYDHCIAMHLEDLKDGRAFVRAARETVPKKPVVVLKAGRTAAGAKAAGSHTGAPAR